jgi:hypothetical protein
MIGAWTERQSCEDREIHQRTPATRNSFRIWMLDANSATSDREVVIPMLGSLALFTHSSIGNMNAEE